MTGFHSNCVEVVFFCLSVVVLSRDICLDIDAVVFGVIYNLFVVILDDNVI